MFSDGDYCKKFKSCLVFIIFMNFFGVNFAKNGDQFNNVGHHNKEANLDSSLESVIERLQSAASILKNQNSNIKPCDNFYEFSCGNYNGWDKVKQKPKTIVSEMHSTIENQISDLIKFSNITANKSRPAELVGTLYNICIDERKIESRGLEPLQKVLKRLDSWPFLDQNSSKSTFDWIKFTTRSKRMGFNGNGLLESVVLSVWNSTHNQILFLEPFLELNHDTFLIGFADKKVKAYYEYMVDTAVLLGINRSKAERDLRKVVNFERKLSRISSNEDDDEFNKTIKTVDDLMKTWPKIDWSKLINKTLQIYGKSDRKVSIAIFNPFYISKLEKLLMKTPKKVIANYLAWKVVKYSAPFMNKQMQKLHNSYMSKIQNDFKSVPRSEACVKVVKESLRWSVYYLYIKEHFRNEIRGNIVKMVDNIKDILINELNTVDWLDEDTKDHAIQKVKRMKSLIGYPDKILNEEELEEFYENLDIDADDDYFGNVLNLRLFKMRKPVDLMINELGPLKEFTDFYSPTFVNAYYLQKLNQIIIPTGILQYIFYSNNRPNYMNYGKVGSIIGHEITHGFDNRGRKFDKNGNFNNWWSAYTYNTYSKKTACFINQYNNYTAQSQSKVDGKLTLNENIADIIGTRIAYLAYQKWVSKNGEEVALPELQYTPNQLFWIAFANFWCESKNTEGDLSDFDPHAPSDVRVIGTLSNIPEFSADFGCSTGSSMNPIKKCTIW